jgi:hypothetical protein
MPGTQVSSEKEFIVRIEVLEELIALQIIF